jgi:hypothetical protein
MQIVLFRILVAAIWILFFYGLRRQSRQYRFRGTITIIDWVSILRLIIMDTSQLHLCCLPFPVPSTTGTRFLETKSHCPVPTVTLCIAWASHTTIINVFTAVDLPFALSVGCRIDELVGT